MHTMPKASCHWPHTMLRSKHLPKDAARVWPVLLHESDVTCSLWGLVRPNVLLLLFVAPLLWALSALLLLLLPSRLLQEKAVSVNRQRAESCSRLEGSVVGFSQGGAATARIKTRVKESGFWMHESSCCLDHKRAVQ